ncbi:unnamed protein product, partial [Acanthoscelides obtectus]
SVIHDLFRSEIALVAYKQLVNVIASIAIDLFQPLLHVSKGIMVGAIVHYDDTMCPSDMTEEKKKWTTEEVGNLIETYRDCPNLWNPTNLEYKNRVKKMDTYKQIAHVFKTTPHEIERKIKNLITQYQRERRSYKKMKKSGAGHVFKAKWFGYSAMSFLHDKNKPRKGTQIGVELEGSDSSDEGDEETQSDMQSTTEATNEYESESEVSECQLTEEIGTPAANTREEPKIAAAASVNKNVSVENTESAEYFQKQASQKPHVFSTPKIGSRKKKRVESDDKNETTEVFQMMKSVFENRQVTTSRRDEYDVFGEMVACNIRHLQTEHARVTVQHKINNLLYEARIGYYNYPETMRVVVPSPSPNSSHTVSSDTQSAMTETEVQQTWSDDVLQVAIASSFGLNTNHDDNTNQDMFPKN